MDRCPFCKAQVSADLVRFGGACPHCFNEIPGEEAATNPGAPDPEEADAQEEESGGRTGILVALSLLLAIGGGVAFWQMSQPEEVAEADGEADAYPTLSFDEIDELHAQKEANEPQEVASASGSTNSGSTARRPSAPDVNNNAIEQLSRFKAEGGTENIGSGSSGSSQDPMRSGLNPGGSSVPLELNTVTNLGNAPALDDPVLIMRMIKDTILDYHLPSVKNCYRRQLNKEEGLEGTWYLDFTIKPNGKTRDVSARGKNGASNSELESCMASQASQWQFAKLAKSQPVTYPFSFQPSDF